MVWRNLLKALAEDFFVARLVYKPGSNISMGGDH